MEISQNQLKKPEIKPNLNLSVVSTVLSLALLLAGCETDKSPNYRPPLPIPFGNPTQQPQQTPTPSK